MYNFKTFRLFNVCLKNITCLLFTYIFVSATFPASLLARLRFVTMRAENHWKNVKNTSAKRASQAGWQLQSGFCLLVFFAKYF